MARQLQGHSIAQATWAAAALWRLSLEPSSAEALLAYRHAAVVRVMCALLPTREESGRRLRFAAVGCLGSSPNPNPNPNPSLQS